VSGTNRWTVSLSFSTTVSGSAFTIPSGQETGLWVVTYSSLSSYTGVGGGGGGGGGGPGGLS
jgi:hypothetical protein